MYPYDKLTIAYRKPEIRKIDSLFLHSQMSTSKKDIRGLTKEQLRDFFVSQGDKAYRGNQV
ncbi:hypothetical protein MHTCC0001_37590 [Flavobacteriaceae bacterium MHTCC 0001]